MNAEVLNSWKEIAAYMGRGVRTVQRWEQELGLPVRRPRGKERSAVIALKSDLDRWLNRVPQGSLTNHAANPQRHEKLHLSTDKLLRRTQELLERSARMQEAVKVTLALTTNLRTRQLKQMKERGTAVNGQKQLVREASRLAEEIAGGDGNAKPASKTSSARI